jgi:hypothetical protein
MVVAIAGIKKEKQQLKEAITNCLLSTAQGMQVDRAAHVWHGKEAQASLADAPMLPSQDGCGIKEAVCIHKQGTGGGKESQNLGTRAGERYSRGENQCYNWNKRKCL